MRNLKISVLVAVLIGGCAFKNPGTPKLHTKIEKQWARSTLLKEDAGYRHTHRMSPLLAGSLVIQGNAQDGITAFDKKSGHRKWSFPVAAGVESGAEFFDDNVYFGANDGKVYALRANDGKLLWSSAMRFEGLGAPHLQGDSLYILSGNGVLYSLNLQTGEKQWTYSRKDTSNLSIRAASQPQSDGNRLYVGFSDGYLVAIDLQKGTLIWETQINENKKFKDVDAQPVVDGQKVYVPSYEGAFYALNATDGRVEWMTPGGGYQRATVLKDQIFVSSTLGEIQAIDKKSGKIEWTKPVTHGIPTGLVNYRGYLIYGESEGDLVVIDSSGTEELGRFSPGRGLLATPTLDPESGDLYFISNNANLFAVRISRKSESESWEWEKHAP